MKLELLRKTDLAVQALRWLALQDLRQQGPVLAAAIGTTPQFLGQVMSPLIASGWVNSARGPTGGYELTVNLGEVSMAAVIEAVEGPIDNGICALRGGPCGGRDQCVIHVPWQHARSAMIAELQSITLADRDFFPSPKSSTVTIKEP